MLVELAVNLGLIQEPEDGSTQFERTAAMREWRLKSWAEQTARIRSIWMSSGFGWRVRAGRMSSPGTWTGAGFGSNCSVTLRRSSRQVVSPDRCGAVDQRIRPGIIGPDATVAVSHATPNRTAAPHQEGVAYLIGGRDPVDPGLARASCDCMSRVATSG